MRCPLVKVFNVQRAANPKCSPKWFAFMDGMFEELTHRNDFVHRERNHQEHDQGSRKAKSAPMTNCNWLENHENDARNASRGTTSTKKNVTIHGIVRQRVFPPIYAMSISKVYAIAPSPASEIGHIRETFEVSTFAVLSPKKGSQTSLI